MVSLCFGHNWRDRTVRSGVPRSGESIWKLHIILSFNKTESFLSERATHRHSFRCRVCYDDHLNEENHIEYASTVAYGIYRATLAKEVNNFRFKMNRESSKSSFWNHPLRTRTSNEQYYLKY